MEAMTVRMRIDILGTRGHIEPSAPGYSDHSGVLIDSTILMDLGESKYIDLRPKAIFLTHLHSDHAAFIETPMDRIDVPVYAPQRTEEHPWLMPMRAPVTVGDHIVTPIPTVHSLTVRSQAYMVEKDLERVIYTGDMTSFAPRFVDRIPEADVVIIDGSFIRRGGLVRRDERTGRPHGHTGIPDLVEMFSPFTERIVVAHFGSWFYKDIAASVEAIESLGDGIKVEAARDGMTIEI